MTAFKKIYNSNKTLLVLEILVPIVNFIIALSLIQFVSNIVLLEGVFYSTLIEVSVLYLVIAVKCLHMIGNFIKEKKIKTSEVVYIVLFLVLGFLTYFLNLFTGILLVGFS